MFRRVLGAAVAATLLAAGAAAAFERPRDGCARQVADPEGDAKYTLSTTGNVKDPRDQSVDALDVRGVAVRHAGDVFEAHVRLKSLSGAFGAHETAYRYDVKFQNADGTKMVLQAMRTNTTWDATPAKASGGSGYPEGSYTVGQTITKFVGVKSDIDAAGGWVTITVPKDEFAKAFSAGVSQGTAVTGITAETYAYIPGTGAAAVRLADTATSADPAQSTYRVGDDYCFGPPPAALTTTLTAPRVAYGDSVALQATLRNEAGEALAGKTVQFSVAGVTRPATTNAGGVATTTFTPAKAAGRYPLTITFPGDETDGRATLTGVSVTVVAETTRLAALKATRTSATARSVTTTLTDDDGRAVPGQKVEWWAGGKRVATTTTDTKGRTTYAGARSGQSVVAKHPGVAGRYLASASRPLTV
jgi:hypothetical protein